MYGRTVFEIRDIIYGVESLPEITGLRGPPAFCRSPTFSRPHGFRVLYIPHVDALSVPKIRCLRGPPTFEGHIVFAGHIVWKAK